jgi:hypothetical protein
MNRLAVVAPAAFFASAALAQDAPPPAEVAGEPISALMFMTLIGGLIIAIGLFAWFLRKRSNRAAAERVFTDTR